MREIIGIPVKRALELPNIRDVKLLAGEEGINRKIVKLNIMEVPDILDWVEEGELLFTTLYSIRDDEQALRNLIPKLGDKKLAGLGIKPGRYVKSIPDFMIKQAEKYNLPLLEVPYDYSFSELINAILKEIINIQTKFLEKTLNIHEDLTGIALSRGGIEKLSLKLMKMVNNPIIILDASKRVMAARIPPRISNDYSKSDFLDHIKNGNGKLDFENRKNVTDLRQVEVKGDKVKQLKFPIMSSDNLFGFIYSWEVSSSFNRLDITTLKWATTIAALDILNKRELAEVERRYKNELLYDIVKGKINDRETLLQRSHHMGMDLNGGYSVILFDTKELVNKYMMKDNRPQRENVPRVVFSVIRDNCDDEIITGLLGSYVVVLYPVSGEDNKENRTKIEEFIEKIKSFMNQDYNQHLKIGVGNYADDILDIQKSYRQAKKSLYVADKFEEREDKTFFYNELGIYKLLYKIENEELNNFIDNTLSPLVEYDREHNTELVKTLETYFEEKGNLTNVSKELYVHYNTAVYRMERIENITGLNLDNPDDRLNLEIALKLYKLNE